MKIVLMDYRYAHKNSSPPLYTLIDNLYSEARKSSRTKKHLLLGRTTRRAKENINTTKLNKIWDKYINQEISVTQLMAQVIHFVSC